MAIKLYGWSQSPYVRLASLVLAEKGVEHELVKNDQKSPDYLANLNPFGKHPALDIDGFVLYESRAIARFIAAKYPDRGPKLLGSTDQEKALIDQWIDVEGHTFHPPAFQIFLEKYIKPEFLGKQTNEAVVEENCTKIENILNVYDAHLSKSKYLVGDSLTLADMVHIPMLYYLVTVSGKGSLVTGRKHLNAWYEDINSRPAWLRIVKDDKPIPSQTS